MQFLVKLLELLLEAAKSLKPPGLTATPEELYKHRIALAYFCGGNAFALVVLFVLAFGVGNITSGFAYASDLTTVSSNIKSDHIDDALERAVTARINACHAREAGDDLLADEYDRQVSRQTARARTLGIDISAPNLLPTCRKIGVVP